MSVDLLLGLQWGDEGKGKIVDVLTESYDIIARFQGGPNAGHTLEFDGIKHVLHTIPSGIFHPSAINLVGNGVVIDPIIVNKELENLAVYKIDLIIHVRIDARLKLNVDFHLIVCLVSTRYRANSFPNSYAAQHLDIYVATILIHASRAKTYT